ncbi:MAG: hypothetical protein U0T11_07145 [Chitinophagaceae bacterium]
MKLKTALLFLFLLSAIVFESCSRSLTPYEAANGTHGRKCMRIR